MVPELVLGHGARKLSRLRIEWRDKSILICGASSGLGRQFAVAVAKQKPKLLVAIGRSEEKLAELRRDLGMGERLITIAVDVCDRVALEDATSSLLANKTFDLLIQAVGQSDRGSLEQLDEQRLHELMHVNVVSCLNAIKVFKGRLANPSTLVLVGSLASHFAPRYLGGYALAKHAVSAVAQQARMELAGDGIHVMLVSPGPLKREDAGTRYEKVDGMPAENAKPGGGAKVRLLDGDRLAEEALIAAAKRNANLILRPWKARLLQVISAISPKLGDLILRNKSG